jgi:hypothetical protein
VKPLIMQFPPLSSYLLRLRPRCFPQHTILKHPQPMYFLGCDRSSFIPKHNNRQTGIPVYFNLCFLITNGKRKDSGPNGSRHTPRSNDTHRHTHTVGQCIAYCAVSVISAAVSLLCRKTSTDFMALKPQIY